MAAPSWIRLGSKSLLCVLGQMIHPLNKHPLSTDHVSPGYLGSSSKQNEIKISAFKLPLWEGKQNK